MPQLNVLQGPIINVGQSISNVIDLGTDYIVGLIMPENWIDAVISVQVSPDGDNFYELHEPNGDPVEVKVVPGTIVNLDPHRLLLARYLRIRSGTKDSPVDQTRVCNFRTIGTMQIAMR